MVRNITTQHRVIDFIFIAIGMYILSIGLGVLGGLFGASVLGTGQLSDLGLAILGILGGYYAGIIISLVIIKTVLRQRGSIIIAIIGAVVWTAMCIGITALFNLADNASSTAVVALFLSTPLVALAAYYLKQPAG